MPYLRAATGRCRNSFGFFLLELSLPSPTRDVRMPSARDLPDRTGQVNTSVSEQSGAKCAGALEMSLHSYSQIQKSREIDYDLEKVQMNRPLPNLSGT